MTEIMVTFTALLLAREWLLRRYQLKLIRNKGHKKTATPR